MVIERLNLAREIDAVADARLVAQSKPAPDIFMKAAELAGVTPRLCVVVEDATAGIEAGKAAGMLTLGIGHRKRFGKADAIIPNLENINLVNLLEKLAVVFQLAPFPRF